MKEEKGTETKLCKQDQLCVERPQVQQEAPKYDLFYPHLVLYRVYPPSWARAL